MLIVNILILIGLILFNGLLALSEMSVVSSRKARLQMMVAEEKHGASAALQLTQESGRFLSTVQIGITLVGIFAGAFGGATLATPFANWLAHIGMLDTHAYNVALGVVVALTTYCTLIIGELVPKRLALNQPEQLARFVAKPMLVISKITAPLVWLLDASTRTVLLLFGDRGAASGNRVTEGEVRSMISEGTAEGVFDPREQAMIDGVLRLDDRSVHYVMVPKPDVTWLDINDDIATIQTRIANTGFSRFLVCRGDIDEIAGFVRTRDILDVLMAGQSLELSSCLVEPLVVLETMPIITLLDLYKNARTHLAVVVDEYGSMVGIATMTDVVEVIAGDLPEHWESGNDHAVQRDDGSWLVDGAMAIEDFQSALALEGLDSGKGYHTVAGFVLSCAQTVPTESDYVYWHNIRFEVMDMDGNRIDKVLVTLPDQSESEDTSSPEDS